MNREFKFKVTQETAHYTLSEFVVWAMNTDRKFDYDAAALKKLFSENRVRINAKLAHKLDAKINIDDEVSVYIKPKDAPKQKLKEDFVLTEDLILYEDVVLMILNKPSGLPTQGTTDPTKDHLFAAAKRFLDQRSPNRENYLSLHHRLDRDTSGVILMCKKKSANKAAQELFSQKKAQKIYWALCHKTKALSRMEWEIENTLAPDPNKRMRMKVASGGDFAHTKFKVLNDFGDYVLIEARPLTGRMHQIRVHLSHYGLPLIGDSMYTDISLDKKLKDKLGKSTSRTLLHAHTLIFPHPVNDKECIVQAPIPKDFEQYINI